MSVYVPPAKGNGPSVCTGGCGSIDDNKVSGVGGGAALVSVLTQPPIVAQLPQPVLCSAYAVQAKLALHVLAVHRRWSLHHHSCSAASLSRRPWLLPGRRLDKVGHEEQSHKARAERTAEGKHCFAYE